MSTAPATTREEILAPIAAAYEELAPDGWGREFVERYYRHTPLDELSSRTPDTFAGVAHSHLVLARTRPPGTANVRVYNPTTEVDGWSNPRTIIQIVTDDMPFLVDSVTGALVQAGVDIHLIIHPQLVVVRDAVGELQSVANRDITKAFRSGAVGELAESWMLLSVDREGDEDRRTEIERTVRSVLEDVRQSVEDWPKMRSRCLVLAAELEGARPPGVDPDEVALATRFLRWMADNHFTFLGYREYTLDQTPAGEVIAPVTGSGLGLLRADPPLGTDPEVLTSEASAIAHARELLVLTKANSKSTVHRVTHLDYVGVKTLDERGEVVGERRFLGLYASTAYTESVLRVPLVAEKVQAVIDRSGLASDSHTGKDLLEVLESYPRDELFQAGRRGPLRDRARGHPAPGASPHQALHPRGRLRPLRLVPRVHPPRPLQHRRPHPDGGHPQGDLRRRGGRVLGPRQRVRPRPTAVRRPGGQGQPDPHPRPRPSARPSSSASSRPAAPGRTGSATPCDAAHGEEVGDRLMDRFGRAFPTAYEESFTVDPGRSPTSATSTGSAADQGTSVALYRPPRRTRRHPPLQAVPRRAAVAHRHPADLHPHGRRGRRRAALRGRARRRGGPARLRLRAARPRPRHLGRLLARAAPRPLRGRRRRGLGRPGRVRRLQQARPRGAPHVAPGRHPAHGRQVPAPDPGHLLAGLPRGRPRRAPRDRPRPRRAVGDALRPGRASPPTRQAEARDAAEEEVAAARARRPRRRVEPRPRPHHPRLPRRHPGRAAHELLPAGPRRRRAPRRTSRSSSTRARCPTCPLRDRSSRSSSTARGSRACTCASARSPAAGCAGRTGARTSAPRSSAWSRRRWSRTPSSCPTGSKGGFYAKQLPDPAADREAWLEEGKAAYRTFISGLLDVTDNRVGRRDRAARAGRAPRRRRPLPRRRRRQGHGDLLRHRQRRRAVVRLLARRRVRVRRLGRLRPQGDGHHRPRRLGVGQAALPRDGRRHPDRGVHRRRRRRHERRRLRQRDAALRAHPPRRGLRPPARLRRPDPDAAASPSPSAGGSSTCRARRGTTTTGRCSPRAAASSRAR